MTADKKTDKHTTKKAAEKPATINLAAEITAAVQTDEEAPAIERVLMESANMLTIDGHPYELVVNYHDGFDKDKLAARFSDILTKYDYIVGDWGYEQLRLKGFYAENNKRAHRDQLITTLQDYLYEYCNFGCAYFVLQRIGTPKRESSNPVKRRRPRTPRRRPQAHTSERHDRVEPIKKKSTRAETNTTTPRKRHFTIRNQKVVAKKTTSVTHKPAPNKTNK
ncbi:YutD family protein [Loigolactobacillus binensis]|uniref:YutD family protein n=1 Tax=Loigolactobacillus binensis TaxID=2559922 RepID=A0ABW3EBE0_9LACO|nr:YutD family protein [Loigolactobacillus binensis]